MPRVLPPGTDARVLRDACRSMAEYAADRLAAFAAMSEPLRLLHYELLAEAAVVAYLTHARRPAAGCPEPSAN